MVIGDLQKSFSWQGYVHFTIGAYVARMRLVPRPFQQFGVDGHNDRIVDPNFRTVN